MFLHILVLLFFPGLVKTQTCSITCPARLDRFNVTSTIMLLIDYQEGVLFLVRNVNTKMVTQNMRFLAKIGKALGMPIVLTTSLEGEAQGAVLADIPALLPEVYAARVKREEMAIPWDDPNYRAAVTKIANGIKNVIMAGITNDVRIAYNAALMAADGYNVLVVQDAGGSPSQIAEDTGRRLWQKAGARTTTTNALAAELGKDGTTQEGLKIGEVFREEVVAHLDAMVAPNPSSSCSPTAKY